MGTRKSVRKSSRSAGDSALSALEGAAAAASRSSCELANPVQVRQIASQAGALLRRMRFVAGRGAMAEVLLVGAPIGRTVSKCHHQGAPSGRNYWQGASTNHYREKLTGKSAQKPQFCAQKVGIGTRERGNWHREAQPLPSCKSPSTLSKCKCLITR